MRRLVPCLLILVILTGCWDKVEIENRIFVSDIGVDLHRESNMNQLLITYQYPNINALGKDASEDKKFFVLTTPSSSVFQASKELTTRSPFPFYFKHVRVLILGGNLIDEQALMKEVIDQLNRDSKINKKLQILIAHGKAEEIINKHISRGHITESSIYSTIKNNRNTGRFIPQTMADMISDFDYSGATITPRIILRDNKYMVSGGCIMKDYKHVGWVCEDENRAIRLLKDRIEAATIDAHYKEDLISYTITRSRSRRKVRVDDGIKADFKVSIKGYLQGYTIAKDRTLYDNRVLEEMEGVFERILKENMEEVVKKLQKTYKADILGIGEDLYKFYPKEWEKVKDKWDEVYPDVEINIDLDVNIRGLGLMR